MNQQKLGENSPSFQEKHQNIPKQTVSERKPFAAYQGTQKLKRNAEKQTLSNQSQTSSMKTADGESSKPSAVQFYPVERVQFISNRVTKTKK